MKFWNKIFGGRPKLQEWEQKYLNTLRELGISESDLDRELDLARYKKNLGMSEESLASEIRFQKIRTEALREQASKNTSIAPVHGAPLGTEFECDECKRHMKKIGAGKGNVILSSAEIGLSVGTAEECRECGRTYCDNCFPNRQNICVCGQHQDAVREVDGVMYRGSFLLIKVNYIT